MSRILYSADAIRKRVVELGQRISMDYAGRELDVICLINGASTFCADLIRQIDVPVRLHPFGFSSYSTAPRSGEVRITLDVEAPLQERDILVVEGVVVSGRTPRYVLDMLRLRRPSSIALCALGMKPHLLSVELEVKYAAFEFGDEMAAGYGVGKGPERALPHIIDIAKGP